MVFHGLFGPYWSAVLSSGGEHFHVHFSPIWFLEYPLRRSCPQSSRDAWLLKLHWSLFSPNYSSLLDVNFQSGWSQNNDLQVDVNFRTTCKHRGLLSLRGLFDFSTSQAWNGLVLVLHTRCGCWSPEQQARLLRTEKTGTWSSIPWTLIHP